MSVNIYGLKDSLIGFSSFFTCPNEAVAYRAFKQFCHKEPNYTDFSLYFLGTFDQNSGTFAGTDTGSPLFVASGKAVEIDDYLHPSSDCDKE